MKIVVVLAAATWLAATPAFTQQATRDEVGRAQSEMLNRVSAAVGAYATSIGIDRSYITYCRVKLDLVGDGHPKDGSIPFGINYYDISRDTLKTQINAREAFERGYLIVCLAETKNTLRAAAAR